MFLGTTIKALDIFWVSSHSLGVRIIHRLFFWIPYYIRNVLKILRTVLNWLNWLGNRINRFIRLCFQEQQLGYSKLFGSVLTHSELESYIIVFFWVSYSVRNVKTKFDIFSQSARPIRKPNQLVHFFF